MAIELDKLKNLLGIAADVTDKDGVLSFALAAAEEIILNYCNINKLPQGLENTLYRMAADIYRNDNYGSAGANSPVASIREGDTQVDFAQSSTSTNYQASILKSYTVQLNRYRRMTW